MRPVSVLVIEADVRRRTAMRRILCRAPGLYVVGEAPEASHAAALIRTRRPTVLLLGGVCAAARPSERILSIGALAERRPVVVVLGEGGVPSVSTLLRAGASAVVTERDTPELVVQALHAAARGHVPWLSPRAAAGAVRTAPPPAASAAAPPPDSLAQPRRTR